MKVYGIKSCDSVKKATTWLTKKKKAFEFHDYKSQGISAEKLKLWSKQVGWETLLNKRSTTWRGLDESIQEATTTEAKAIELMIKNTSLIKRPLIEENDKVLALGFDEKVYALRFRQV